MMHHTTVIINNLGPLSITFPAAYFGMETEIENLGPSGAIYFGSTPGVSEADHEFALLPNEKVSLGPTPRSDLHAISSLPYVKLGIFSDMD